MLHGDPLDTPPLVDQLYRILPPGQEILPLLGTEHYSDGQVGLLVMAASIIVLGVLFWYQIQKRFILLAENEFTGLSMLPTGTYIIGMLMYAKSVNLVGLPMHILYMVSMLGIGFMLTHGVSAFVSLLATFVGSVGEFLRIPLKKLASGGKHRGKEMLVTLCRHAWAYVWYGLSVVADRVKEARKIVA